MHAICESQSGYCYQFRLDGAKKEIKENYVETIINYLLNGLENRGHILDSWYSSLLLFEQLIKKELDVQEW